MNEVKIKAEAIVDGKSFRVELTLTYENLSDGPWDKVGPELYKCFVTGMQLAEQHETGLVHRESKTRQ